MLVKSFHVIYLRFYIKQRVITYISLNLNAYNKALKVCIFIIKH